MILAYHTALYTSGHILSRDILVQCLNLATTVAGSPTLTEAFIESKRMGELVDVFALSSQEIASIKDMKPSSSKKRVLRGASLDIWKVEQSAE